MEKIKLGIIGLDKTSRWYVHTLQEFVLEADLIAASSKNLEELELVESEFGIKQNYVDLRDMLSLHELDGVIIASSPSKRIRQAIEALDKGFHVLVLTPIAFNVSDCDKLIKKASRYPNQLAMAAMFKRFAPIIKEAKKAIMAGEIGNILSIHMESKYIKEHAAQDDMELAESGSVFMDFGIQDIDLIRFLTGEEFLQGYALSQSFKENKKSKADNFRMVKASGKLSGDILYDMQITIAESGMHSCELSIKGTKGVLKIDRPGWRIQREDQTEIKTVASQNFQSQYEYALIQQMKAFCEAARSSGKSLVKIEDAREAVKVSVALSKSLALNELVDIS